MAIKKYSSNYKYLLIAVIFVGVWLVWYSTEQWGSGLISDTYQYVSAAKSFASGRGLHIPYGDGELLPMTKYPPMLSMVLAFLEVFKINIFQGATFLNIFLFGMSIMFVSLVSKRLTNSILFSILAALLVAISPVMVEVHAWLLSEPLYISLSLFAFILMGSYFEHGTRKLLILVALIAALLFLTRFVGLSLIVTIFLILLFIQKSPWKQRVLDVLVFGFVSTFPTILWAIRGFVLTGIFNDRSIQYHPPSTKNYYTAINNILNWFLPGQLVDGNEKMILMVGGLIVLGALVYFLFYSNKDQIHQFFGSSGDQKSLILHSLYIVMYGILVIISKMWFDDRIGMTDRILSPIYISMVILLVFCLARLSKLFGKVTLLLCEFCGVLLVIYNLVGVVPVVQDLNDKGAGVFHSGWHGSEVVGSLPGFSEYSIFTNSNSTLYLWSDRTGYSLDEFRSTKEKGIDHESLLVVFKHVPPKGDKLDKLVSGLELLTEDKFVAIYLFGPTQ